MDGQGTTWRRNIAENFNRLSRVHERYRRQTTDGPSMTYSEHELEFTFANKLRLLLLQINVHDNMYILNRAVLCCWRRHEYSNTTERKRHTDTQDMRKQFSGLHASPVGLLNTYNNAAVMPCHSTESAGSHLKIVDSASRRGGWTGCSRVMTCRA